jgi:hypothetical protein
LIKKAVTTANNAIVNEPARVRHTEKALATDVSQSIPHESRSLQRAPESNDISGLRERDPKENRFVA